MIIISLKELQGIYLHILYFNEDIIKHFEI